MLQPLINHSLSYEDMLTAAYEFCAGYVETPFRLFVEPSKFEGLLIVRLCVGRGGVHGYDRIHTFSGPSLLTALRRLVECLPDQLAQRQGVELVSGIFSRPAH